MPSHEYVVIWQREGGSRVRRFYQTLKGAERCAEIQRTAAEECDWWTIQPLIYGPFIRSRPVGIWSPMSDEPPRLSSRKCRWCGKTYKAPVWERWAGCKECAPTIEDAVKEVEHETKLAPPRRSPLGLFDEPVSDLSGTMAS